MSYLSAGSLCVSSWHFGPRDLADCDWEDNAGAEDAAVLFEEKWLAFLLSSNFQWELPFKKSEWNRNLKQWLARQGFEDGQLVDWEGLIRQHPMAKDVCHVRANILIGNEASWLQSQEGKTGLAREGQIYRR